MSLTVNHINRSELEATAKTWCRTWNVVRRDLAKFYWTDHDAKIDSPLTSPRTYTPVGALSVSDISHRAGGSPRLTATLSGPVSEGHVTREDVRGGLWANARVTQRILNWLHPWRGAVITTTFYIVEPRFDDERFEFEVAGVDHFLDAEIGIVCSRQCRHEFGAAFGKASTYVGCRFDLEKLVADGGQRQAGVEVDTLDGTEPNRIFTATTASMSSTSDDHYNYGTVTFRSGANVGVPGLQIYDYTDTSRQIELEIPAPFNVAVGDLCDVRYGCDRSWDACIDATRQQEDYFGGFRRMPTESALSFQPRFEE